MKPSESLRTLSRFHDKAVYYFSIKDTAHLLVADPAGVPACQLVINSAIAYIDCLITNSRNLDRRTRREAQAYISHMTSLSNYIAAGFPKGVQLNSTNLKMSKGCVAVIAKNKNFDNSADTVLCLMNDFQNAYKLIWSR